MTVSSLSHILCVFIWQVGVCFGWWVNFFLLYLSSVNLRALSFLKKEEDHNLRTRKEHSMQCALSYNGFASVISAFWNSLKYCFFSLYLNPTNGYHYHRSTSARTNHTSEKRHLYSDTLLFSFLITEKTSNQYPLSQNSERLPSFSLIFQPLPPNTKITASPITTNQNLKCEPQNQPNKI